MPAQKFVAGVDGDQKRFSRTSGAVGSRRCEGHVAVGRTPPWWFAALKYESSESRISCCPCVEG